MALLGLGFMGSTHAKAWQQVAGARLAAVMSSDERKLEGDLSAIQGNLGGPGERMDFTGVSKYRAVEAALNDPEIDAVDICLPTDQHASVAIAALRAGKHVLVEKPIALDYATACSAIAEAERAGRILMAAQVLRFIPAYAEFRKLGGGSRAYSATFRRRCAAPAWSKWLGDAARSGGGVFDLLIHDADYCISLWGMPESVRASGYEDLAAGVDVIHGELIYPGMGPVIVTGGWHHPKAYPFGMEFTVVTEAGTFEWVNPSGTLKRYTPEGTEVDYALDPIDPFAAELGYFAECVRLNRKPALCPPEQSAESVALMQFMLESRSKKGEIIACRI